MSQYDLDIHHLGRYLATMIDDFGTLQTAEKINGGQSNPTYLLKATSGSYVLRRKPVGVLLASAHAVDREYRVLSALAATEIPVPAVLHLCEDESVIGSMFYVMEYLPGRVFWSPHLAELSASERQAIYNEMNSLLVKLHSVDIDKVGLSGFGNPANYFERQINRWTGQYRSSETEQVDAMETLIAWLSQKRPEGNNPKDNGKAALVHGDFRLDNIIFSQSGANAIGILDWELSTLGHPYADLAYQCMQWRLPAEHEELRGLGGVDRGDLGIPTEEQYIENYCQGVGISGIRDWNFYLAVSFFRLAAICQGVYKRGLDGNASNARAIRFGKAVNCIAKTALTVLD